MDLDHLLLRGGKHLFLDLEDTVITPNIQGWRAVDFMNNNIDLVKNIITEFAPDTVNVFSFAIDHDEDQVAFMKDCGVFLENNIGCKFTIVPHMEHIRKVLCDINGLTVGAVPREEICTFWSKQRAMRDWLVWNQKQHKKLGTPLEEIEVFFLDDTVETELIELPDLKIELMMENPQTM